MDRLRSMTEEHLRREYPHAYPVLELISNAKSHGGLIVYDVVEALVKDLTMPRTFIPGSTSEGIVTNAVARVRREWDV